MPKKISNADMIALVNHPFRLYRLGQESSLVLAPRDYTVAPPPNHFPPRAKLIEVYPIGRRPVFYPPDGPLVEPNLILTLTFDHPVAAVAGATGSGTTWRIPVATLLHITWRNNDNSAGGPSFLGYNVRVPPPPPPLDTAPPEILGGNIVHGAFNVDPGPLNNDRILITFNENVTGSIELRYEDNTRVDWHGTVTGKRAELRPGRELLALAVTYKVIINVSDEAGNKAHFVVEFTTFLKEAERWPRRR